MTRVLIALSLIQMRLYGLFRTSYAALCQENRVFASIAEA